MRDRDIRYKDAAFLIACQGRNDYTVVVLRRTSSAHFHTFEPDMYKRCRHKLADQDHGSSSSLPRLDQRFGSTDFAFEITRAADHIDVMIGLADRLFRGSRRLRPPTVADISATVHAHRPKFSCAVDTRGLLPHVIVTTIPVVLFEAKVAQNLCDG